MYERERREKKKRLHTKSIIKFTNSEINITSNILRSGSGTVNFSSCHSLFNLKTVIVDSNSCSPYWMFLIFLYGDREGR